MSTFDNLVVPSAPHIVKSLSPRKFFCPIFCYSKKLQSNPEHGAAVLGTGARTGRFRRERNRKESRFSGRVRVFLFLRAVLGRKKRKPGRKRRRQCSIYSVRWWSLGRLWSQTTASTSISTSPPRGSSLTATQERAGGFSANTLEYSVLTNGKSAMLVMNTVVLTTFSTPAPAAVRSAGCSSGSVPSGRRRPSGSLPWRDRCRAVRSSTGFRLSGRLGSKGRWLRAHRRWRGWFS